MDNVQALAELQYAGAIEKDGKSRKPSQAQVLLEVCASAALFHTPDQEAFASVRVNGHIENWPIRSKGFRNWLGKQYYEKTKGSPSSQAIVDALSTLEGRAQFGGSEEKVYLRVAGQNEKIFIDKGDESWKVIEISKTGVRELSESPIKFRRTKGILPLPDLQEGIDQKEFIEKLRTHLNIESFESFQLVVAFIVASFLPEGPFPVLVTYGEQGTGKSTLVKAVRSLIDPNTAPLRKEPRTTDDLMVAAKNNWIMAFDNVSSISNDMSDDICRISTGGAISKRELYTDDGEIVIEAKRPSILNGIEEFITRGDLADRSIVLHLPTISEEKRSSEEKFWKSFNSDKPGIFTAICQALSFGLRAKNSMSLSRRPRMADAFFWATACEGAFGWKYESTLHAFFENQKMANEVVLENSPLFPHLKKYAEQKFSGTATQLLENIKQDAPASDLRFLPGSAIKLGDKLRRLTPALLKSGIKITISRTAAGRRIELEKVGSSRTSLKSTVTVVTQPGKYAPPGPGHDDHDSYDDLSRQSSDGVKHAQRDEPEEVPCSRLSVWT